MKDTLKVRAVDLRAILDALVTSMDFGSGFLDEDEVRSMRRVAELLEVDPNAVTPANWVCQQRFRGHHRWKGDELYCLDCGECRPLTEAEQAAATDKARRRAVVEASAVLIIDGMYRLWWGLGGSLAGA